MVAFLLRELNFLLPSGAFVREVLGTTNAARAEGAVAHLLLRALLALRCSLSAIATACFWLVTFGPRGEPLWSWPLPHSCITVCTFRPAGDLATLLAPARGRAAPEPAESLLHAGIAAAAVAAGFHRRGGCALVCRSPERRRTVAMAGHLLPVVLHRAPAAIRRRCCFAHENLLVIRWQSASTFRRPGSHTS